MMLVNVMDFNVLLVQNVRASSAFIINVAILLMYWVTHFVTRIKVRTVKILERIADVHQMNNVIQRDIVKHIVVMVSVKKAREVNVN